MPVRARFPVAISLSLLTVATVARAEEVGSFASGPELSLRLGPSFVAGNAEKGQPLHEQVGAPLSFMLDGGYRATPRFYVGGFWAMGFGLVSPRPCPAGFECSAPGLITSIGGGGRFHLVPDQTLDPWVGAGVALDVEGYKGTRSEERTGVCVFPPCTGVSVDSSTTRFGASLLFEGGLDVRISHRVGLGISAAAFAGKYLTTDTTVRKEDNDIGGSGGAADGGYHLWLLTSARAVVNLP